MTTHFTAHLSPLHCICPICLPVIHLAGGSAWPLSSPPASPPASSATSGSQWSTAGCATTPAPSCAVTAFCWCVPSWTWQTTATTASPGGSPRGAGSAGWRACSCRTAWQRRVAVSRRRRSATASCSWLTRENCVWAVTGCNLQLAPMPHELQALSDPSWLCGCVFQRLLFCDVLVA